MTFTWPYSPNVPVLERPVRQAPSPQATPPELARVKSALDAIPNSGDKELSYDRWRNVLFGLHFATKGSDDGLALAHEFSARSAKYNADFLDSRVWPYIRSDRSGPMITDQSVYHEAYGSGWVDPTMADGFDVMTNISTGARPVLPAFRRDNNGHIIATIKNAVLAVSQSDFCGMDIRYDLFRDEVMFARHGDDQFAPFADVGYSRLRITLENHGFKPVSRDLIRDAVHFVADNNRFDSAITWLERKVWDDVPRVDKFLARYFSAEDTEYTSAVSRYIWTAMAGRVLVPGIKADMVPILVGEQGSVKSSSVAAMVPAPEFFCEISFGESEDDQARKMRGRLVAEIAELRGLRTRDLETIKSFITRTHEIWVPKYKEFAVNFPRRLVFIGTTNEEEFLADETGNRRWLPVRVGRADIEAIKRDREQLWAEGRTLFVQDGVAYEAAERLAPAVHADHTIGDPWEEVVSKWLDTEDTLGGGTPRDREFLRVGDVLLGALRADIRNIRKADEMRACKVLQACGYTRVNRRVAGVPAKVWVQMNPPATTGGGEVVDRQGSVK